MLKKLLSIVLTVMLVSSIGVVAGAETTSEATQKTVWVENFDSIDPAHLANASATSTSPLWVLTKNCTKHTPYNANGEGGHYHLNDGWTIQSRGFQSGSYAAYNAWSLVSGDQGKKNSDKSLYATKLRYDSINLKNDFDGTPIDLTSGKAVGFSFDWYNSTFQYHANQKNLTRNVIVTATLAKEGADDIQDVELTLGKIEHAQFIPAVGSTTTLGRESWHDFAVLVSKDKVTAHGSSETESVSFDIANYTPKTGEVAASWSSSANSGYYIKSIKSVEVHLVGSKDVDVDNGIDNLKAWVEDTMPEMLPEKSMPVYTDFRAGKSTLTTIGQGSFVDQQSRAINGEIVAKLSGTLAIKPSLVVDNNDTAKGNDSKDAWLKITTDPAGATAENSFYSVMFGNANLAEATTGDAVHVSCKIKINGADGAQPFDGFFTMESNFTKGKGTVVSIDGIGNVFDPQSIGNVSLAKLSKNTWYELDAVFTLEESGTKVTVYINGVPVLKKTMTTAQTSGIPLARFIYYPTDNNDGTAYLANTVYLDDLCYRVFEDGKGVYNFDKYLINASNKVIAAAEANFVNNVIAPVSEDWTVADFNALGLANATVVDSDGAVVTEGLLKDNKIKFTGDYGKDTLYTVSKEGATTLSKNHLVIVKQGSAIAPNGNVSTTSAVSAKAYNTAGSLTVITAEYEGGKLVAAKVGADYTPTASGNKIKVFTLKDLNTLVPTASHTEFNVVE